MPHSEPTAAFFPARKRVGQTKNLTQASRAWKTDAQRIGYSQLITGEEEKEEEGTEGEREVAMRSGPCISNCFNH